jgi:hypothetical protein
MYKHKSGAEKREAKKLKEEEAERGIRTLDSLNYFKKNDSRQTKTSSDILEDLDENSAIPVDQSKHENETSSTNDENNESPDASTSVIPECHELTDSVVSSMEISSIRFFDIGNLENGSQKQINEAASLDPERFPEEIPADKSGMKFPRFLLKSNDLVERDWLCWSRKNEALYCYPCRLFSTLPENLKSSLATKHGWKPDQGYRQLYMRVPEHANSTSHKTCYLKWRNHQKIFGSKRMVRIIKKPSRK